MKLKKIIILNNIYFVRRCIVDFLEPRKICVGRWGPKKKILLQNAARFKKYMSVPKKGPSDGLKKLDPVGSLLSRLFNYVFEGRKFANSNSEINKFA